MGHTTWGRFSRVTGLEGEVDVLSRDNAQLSRRAASAEREAAAAEARAQVRCGQHDRIDAQDPVRFDTMMQACNCVVGTDYTGLQRAYFTPRVFRGTERENTKLWFPHLAVGIRRRRRRAG